MVALGTRSSHMLIRHLISTRSDHILLNNSAYPHHGSLSSRIIHAVAPWRNVYRRCTASQRLSDLLVQSTRRLLCTCDRRPSAFNGRSNGASSDRPYIDAYLAL